MRLKGTIVVFKVLLILAVCFIVYMTSKTTTFLSRKTSEALIGQANKLLDSKNNSKLALKSTLNLEGVVTIDRPSSTIVSNKQTNKQMNKLQASKIIYDHSCPFQVDYTPRTNIQMLHMLEQLKFDNTAWKKNLKVKENHSKWNKKRKLKIFVVPHSHNTAGLYKTMEEYYFTETRYILDNMLIKLEEDPRQKFIWAEILYFSMWWEGLKIEKQKAAIRLIHNNQLEIVTGSWVINDEANPHWISIMHQMTVGHQWLENNLNYMPKSHWSIGPYGFSATQPMLLKEMGLQNMLIQNVHYAVKSQLARHQNLEFRWKQTWDDTGKTQVFTHIMPYYSYTIPYSCGPNPNVCCQFDFMRLHGLGLSCPWKVPPQPLTDLNVQERAKLLLDQYRKKASLFKTNVLLVPLGDDFRYNDLIEWDLQYNNYQRLFDFMNKNSTMHVQIQFGTLTDYFNAVLDARSINNFPTLSGDFFTYADRKDHYWSGYFTSRPFYKKITRELLSYVRAAEIILALTHLKEGIKSDWITSSDHNLDKSLSEAHKSLALFQHHEGITGTSSDRVVIDYGIKMLKAIEKTQNIIQKCAYFLLLSPTANISKFDKLYYSIDDIRQQYDSLPKHLTVLVAPSLGARNVTIFNSLPFARNEIVSFIVTTPFIEVSNFQGERVKCQLSPIFECEAKMSYSKYKLSFIANVPALGLVSYKINPLFFSGTPQETLYPSLTVFTDYDKVEPSPEFPFSNFDVFPTPKDFEIKNDKITATFNKLGLLKALNTGSGTIPVHLTFVGYSPAYAGENREAYVFLPDGKSTDIQIKRTIVKIIEGPLESSVIVELPSISHTVTLYNTLGADGLALNIQNIVKVQKTGNYEIAMRLSTNISSIDEYFTDLNGYQILRRKRFTKLPLQANYYPMSTMVYIEDKHMRLTALASSPLGCASLKSGEIEIILDRKFEKHDLGSGQPVLDVQSVKHTFRIILERKLEGCEATSNDHPAGFPSLAAHVSLESLLNPLIRMVNTGKSDLHVLQAYSPVTNYFGVDFTLPSLRPGIKIKNNKYTGIVLHRQYLDLCFGDEDLFKQFPLSDGTVNLSALLPGISNVKFSKTLLSFLNIQENVNIQSNISLCPMGVQAFVIHK